MKNARSLAALVLIPFLGSCALGKENVLFTTTTTIGVDVDSKPATFAIGYERKEGSLAPVVESGGVLPLFAGIKTETGFVNNAFGFGTAQSFAVGTAALIMTKYLNEDIKPDAKQKDLQDLLNDRGASAVAGTIEGSKRYFFGTDTTFGFKVSTSVETGAPMVPDSITVGWKRKEFAFVPIQEIEKIRRSTDGRYVDRNGRLAASLPTGRTPAQLAVEFPTETHLIIPSLIATAGATARAGEDAVGAAGITQLYATGLAASYLASDPVVRSVLASQIVGSGALDEAIEEKWLKEAIEQDKIDRDSGANQIKTCKAIIGGLSGEQIDRALATMLGLGIMAADDAEFNTAGWAAQPDDDAKINALQGSFDIVDEEHPDRIPLLHETLLEIHGTNTDEEG